MPDEQINLPASLLAKRYGDVGVAEMVTFERQRFAGLLGKA